jgi:hypothetical protein
MGHSEFRNLTQDVKDEVIIYTPPDWQLHDEYIENKFPGSKYHQLSTYVFKALQGQPKTKHEQWVLNISGLPANSSVFTTDVIERLAQIPRNMVKSVLYRSFPRAKRYMLFHPLDPDDPYEEFEKLPDGTLALRSVYANRYDMWDRSGIKYICQIFVVPPDWKEIKYWIIDAIANGAKSDWYKMKAVIEDAKDY